MLVPDPECRHRGEIAARGRATEASHRRAGSALRTHGRTLRQRPVLLRRRAKGLPSARGLHHNLASTKKRARGCDAPKPAKVAESSFAEPEAIQSPCERPKAAHWAECNCPSNQRRKLSCNESVRYELDAPAMRAQN
ncbi:hypothetical protein L1887_63499 [Cichorium endivia]|nr:hypothetical protein L1887_63499 [Cichorium endivia]